MHIRSVGLVLHKPFTRCIMPVVNVSNYLSCSLRVPFTGLLDKTRSGGEGLPLSDC